MKDFLLPNHPLLTKIRLDESLKRFTLFFHQKKAMIDTHGMLTRAMQALNNFEEGSMFHHAYRISLEILEINENKNNLLSLTGSLSDILSLLFSEKILNYTGYKQLLHNVNTEHLKKKKANNNIFTQFLKSGHVNEKQTSKGSTITIDDTKKRVSVIVTLQTVDMSKFYQLLKDKFPSAKIIENERNIDKLSLE